MRSTPFEMNICKLRSVLAYQGEVWVDSMLNDQNLEQYWRCDFRMIQDTFRNIVRAVQPALKKTDTQFRHAIPIEKRTPIAL